MLRLASSRATRRSSSEAPRSAKASRALELAPGPLVAFECPQRTRELDPGPAGLEREPRSPEQARPHPRIPHAPRRTARCRQRMALGSMDPPSADRSSRRLRNRSSRAPPRAPPRPWWPTPAPPRAARARVRARCPPRRHAHRARRAVGRCDRVLALERDHCVAHGDVEALAGDDPAARVDDAPSTCACADRSRPRCPHDPADQHRGPTRPRGASHRFLPAYCC